MDKHLYDQGTSDYGMKDGYRLRVVQDEGTDSPLTWNDEETRDGWAYKQWRASEVYIVHLEKRVRLVNAEDPTDVREEWDLADSLGDCYLTPADSDQRITRYSAWDVARDHFAEAIAPHAITYRLTRTTSKDRLYEVRTSGEHLSIAAALDELAPIGDREGTNRFTAKMDGERRDQVIANLERRGHSGYTWVDFTLTTGEIIHEDK